MKIDRHELEVRFEGTIIFPSHIVLEQYSRSLPYCQVVLSGENRQSTKTGGSISIGLDGERLFTGSVLGKGRARGGDLLKCGFNLAPSIANLRKEMAPYIFEKLAEQSAVEDFIADIPEVEFQHFHCSGDGWGNLLSLATALEDFSDASYDLFFDNKGALNLKPVRQAGYPKVEFERGKNVILMGYKRLKSFPVPLGYGDLIGVNQEVHRVTGLRYEISPRNSLMEVFF